MKGNEINSCSRIQVISCKLKCGIKKPEAIMLLNLFVKFRFEAQLLHGARNGSMIYQIYSRTKT